MPKIIQSKSELITLQDVANKRALAEKIKYADTCERIKRRKYAGYARKPALDGEVYCGDYTRNAPSLRKDAKVTSILQREVNQNTRAYLTSRGGLFNPPDYGEDTMRILTQYRFIVAARKPRLHDIVKGGDNNERT